MTPAEFQYWQKANRRALSFAPEIRAAILRAFAIIRDSLSEVELEQIIASGHLDLLFQKALSEAVLDRAFIPLRQRLRQSTEKAFKYATTDLPNKGRVDGTLSVMFDHLNPDVITAIRELDTKVIDRLKTDAREMTRAVVENGLRDGVNPRTTARQLRSVIGLAPNQEEAVRNYERALRGENPNASPLDYQLRNKRYDALVKRGEMTEQQIETAVNAYRKSMVAFNAETNARTASLDAMKLGQKLSWQSAIDRSIVDADRLTKRWSGVMDDRERPEHVEMQGETVPWDALYSNGEDVPGESTFNCRCLSMFSQTPL